MADKPSRPPPNHRQTFTSSSPPQAEQSSFRNPHRKETDHHSAYHSHNKTFPVRPFAYNQSFFLPSPLALALAIPSHSIPIILLQMDISNRLALSQDTRGTQISGPTTRGHCLLKRVQLAHLGYFGRRCGTLIWREAFSRYCQHPETVLFCRNIVKLLGLLIL